MNDAGALPEDLVFEDPYEDELESEEEVNPADVGDGAGAGAGGAGAGGAGAGGMDLDDEEDPDSLPTRVRCHPCTRAFLHAPGACRVCSAPPPTP